MYSPGERAVVACTWEAESVRSPNAATDSAIPPNTGDLLGTRLICSLSRTRALALADL